MSTTTSVVLITVSTLNLCVTSALLIGLMKGKKEMETKIADVQNKANQNVKKLKQTLLEMDL